MKIKVLSLNIEHGGVLMEALVPFLQAADADILLLQEIHSGARRLPPLRKRSLRTRWAAGIWVSRCERSLRMTSEA